MFDQKNFPELWKEYPQTVDYFLYNPEKSIRNRVQFWIKQNKEESLIIEGVKLLKEPNWKQILRQAIKRNWMVLIQFILERASNSISAVERLDCLETAQFFQKKFNNQIIELLKKYSISYEADFISQGLYLLEQNILSQFEILKNNGSLTKVDNLGYTLAHYAARQGFHNLFQWLSQDINLFRKIMNIKSHKGENTPLHIAIQNDQQKLDASEWINPIETIENFDFNWLSELISKAKNKKGETPLYIAAKLGYLKIFDKFYRNSNPNLQEVISNKGFSILNIICQKNRMEILEYLKNNYTQELNETISTDDFILSAKYGKIDLVTTIETILLGKQRNTGKQNLQNKELTNSYGNQNAGLKHCNFLQSTVKYGNIEIIKHLFEFEYIFAILPDAPFISAYFGHYFLTEYFVKSDFNLFEKCNKKNAMQYLYLVKTSNNIDIQLYLLNTMICWAIQKNDNEFLEEFWKELELYPSCINQETGYGSILHRAVKQRNMQIIDKIIRLKSANPVLNIIDDEKRTPLFYCIDNISIFQKLIENGADPFLPDKNQLTVLHLIAQTTKVQLIEIVSKKFKNYQKIIPGKNLIAQALQHDQQEMAVNLINQFPKEGMDRRAKPILFLIAEKNYYLILQKLQESGLRSFDQINNQLETPLIIAIKKANEKVAIQLIRYGANVNHETIKKQIPLHFALTFQCSDYLISQLLNKGSNPFLADNAGMTPYLLSIRNENELTFTSFNNYLENPDKLIDVISAFEQSLNCQSSFFALQLLIKMEKLNISPGLVFDKKGRNLLIQAIVSKKQDIAIKIIELFDSNFRPRINEYDQDGKTALYYACEQNQIQLVQILLKQGALIEKAFIINKENVLTQLIINNNIELLKFIIEIKPEDQINLRNSEGDTALSKAIELENDEISTMLINCPITDLSFPNFKGETPIMKAIIKKNLNLIKLLFSSKLDINFNLPDNSLNYPLLVLPFDIPEKLLDILKTLKPQKNKIDFFVKDTNKGYFLIKILKQGPQNPSQNQKLILSRIFSFCLKVAFGTAKHNKELNWTDKANNSSFDQAFIKKYQRIAKKLLFAGCNGNHKTFILKKRFIAIIANIHFRMKKTHRKEKRWEILDEIIF